MQAYLRMLVLVLYLGALPDDLLEDLTDGELMAVLGNETVRAAISRLTSKQRERLAEVIGLSDRGEVTQANITVPFEAQVNTR